jgi:quinol monooxygenase YgiN
MKGDCTMPHTIAIHKVEDYTTWKSSFNSAESKAARKAGGEKSYMILQTVDDPNKFVLLNEWQNMEGLSDFINSEKLRELQAASGVVGKPEILIFDKVEKGSI